MRALAIYHLISNARLLLIITQNNQLLYLGNLLEFGLGLLCCYILDKEKAQN